MLYQYNVTTLPGTDLGAEYAWLNIKIGKFFMRVFITGATGFIGYHVVKDLIANGHEVLGLARSKEKGQALIEAGAQVHVGSLEDLESLRSGAAAADGVIHTAFIHDFSKFMESCQTDRRVIETIGEVLAGSGKPFIVTSGTGVANTVPGQLAIETNTIVSSKVFPRAMTEEAVADGVARGVNVSVVRLPQVHDAVKQGLISYLISVAQEKGVSAYVGDGQNRWPAVHVLDAARVYRLALEKGNAEAKYHAYHAVGEEGVTLREIAEAVGRGLKVSAKSISQEEASTYFGWLGMLAGLDMPASSALTQQHLNWRPIGPGLIADLEKKN
jgi:nucleoside-diphosphate-sugar epimerase